MNQILVTEKLYVTPELKRRKHIYKLEFLVSIFLICLLFSHYIYAQYDMSKGEQTLNAIKQELNYDKMTIKEEDNNNVILVFLSEEEEKEHIEQMIDIPQKEELNENLKTYTSTDGVKYTIEARLQIPKINLDYPVLSETSPDLLFVSLNKFFGPKPNQIGNYCIAGHYYSSNKMFGYLNKLEKGDIAKLTDLTTKSGKTLEYEVIDTYIVNPKDTQCTSQLTSLKNRTRELTLITCTNHGKQRLVVKLREV